MSIVSDNATESQIETTTPGAGGPIGGEANDTPTPDNADPIETFEKIVAEGGEPTEAQTEAAVEEFIEKLVDGDDDDDDFSEVDDE